MTISGSYFDRNLSNNIATGIVQVDSTSQAPIIFNPDDGDYTTGTELNFDGAGESGDIVSIYLSGAVYGTAVVQ